MSSADRTTSVCVQLGIVSHVLQQCSLGDGNSWTEPFSDAMECC